MDRLKRTRRPLRRVITQTCNEVDTLLANENPDLIELRVLVDRLDKALAQVIDVDQKILDALLDANCTDEDQDKETEEIQEYSDKVNRAKFKVDKILYPAQGNANSPTPSEYSTAASIVQRQQRNYKLPKIELKTFNGDLKEWLGFWSQFLKIHEDEDLDPSDKFQYLLQAMVPGTEAREIVESYPLTALNYPKAIESLKEAFGQESLQVQVYVRELLKLVITNVNSKDKIPLSKMYVKLESHLRALSSLNLATADPSTWLFPLVESSLPEDVLRAWQRSPLSKKDGTKENPPKTCLDLLMEFLKNEVQGEKRITLACDDFGNLNVKDKKAPYVKKKLSSSLNEEIPTAAGLYSGQAKLCIFCEKDSHEGHECLKAQSMLLEELRKIAKEKKRCTNCLREGHFFKECKSPVKCLICFKRHLTLMCPDRRGSKSAVSKKPPTKPPSAEEVTSANLNCTREVILQTLILYVWASTKFKKVRALIDNGSQRSYILKKLARELKLISKRSANITHIKFGNHRQSQQHNEYEIKLTDLNKEFSFCMEVLDQEEICGDIPRVQRRDCFNELSNNNIFINDSGDGTPEIEILIGADFYGKLLTGRIHQLENGLTAVETLFGWTLLGNSNAYKKENLAMATTAMLATEMSLPDLWKLETIGIMDPIDVLSKEEKEIQVQKHFQKTVSRTPEGHYSVSLPWVDGEQNIPSNRSVAEKILGSATTKLLKANKFDDYQKMFDDWLREGFIELVNEDAECYHFLPHRPVFKPDSKTTPVRPVFNASFKVGRNPSLNDCLEKGPNLLDLLPSFILRFRQKKIPAIADIRKAFQMVGVKESDRKFLNFLWWEDYSKKKLKVYRHARVVFGVNCSPYLLTAVINHHLSQVAPADKNVAEEIRKSLYVDNLVTSVNTEEEYATLRKKGTKIMADAKMDLRLWESTIDKHGSEDKITNVLGHLWNKDSDTLSCDPPRDLEEIMGCSIITKRTILSVVSKVFDQIGFTCPALIPPKLILQEAWARKLGWDIELPEEGRNQFQKWLKEVKSLFQIHIPRFSFANSNQEDSIQIHCFSDASKNAYATVIYARVENGDTVTVNLLQAKARIAPIKRPTIPRMELMSCVIGTRLTNTVKTTLEMHDVPTYFWTDSTTALQWILINDNWGTFVGNRVKEICQLSKTENWAHIPGIHNPADLPSRGCTPHKLLKSKWWEGPEWLKQPVSSWPKENYQIDEDEVRSELKKSETTVLLSTPIEIPWYCKTFSSFLKNVRVLAWIRRFILSMKSKTRMKSELTMKEIEEAENLMFRLIQTDAFPNSLTSIRGLDVQRDQNNLLHVTTRLLNRSDSELFKKPILLPPIHPAVDQLIRFEHEINQHAGTQILMSKLRERVWILRSRQAIKRIISKCVTCRRYTTKTPNVPPAPLPEDRVTSAKTFQITGVDLTGPLFLKDSTKTWIVLFTCAVYRCIHLEMVDSLSTEAFLMALIRFISRRGRPTTIYSDNGTNFHGANNLFQNLDWEKISKEAQIQRINWKFNPPSAAWWGGWWERLVRSVKDILKRMLGKKRLNFMNLQTMLCEAEAILNNRPLTYITEDKDDLIPLTPAMFMNEITQTNFPEINELTGESLREKYGSMRQLRTELENRFRSEYLAQLVNRGKCKNIHQFRVGDVVLVASDNKKRLEWPMAKITELIPGKDSNIRVARVKTSSGFLIRPLQRLYPLEVTSYEDIQHFVKDKNQLFKQKQPAVYPEVITRFGRKVKKPIRLGSIDE